jgi:hypothetical protein
MPHIDVSALGAGAALRVAIEDTASSTPFSDAETVAVFDFRGGIGIDVCKSVRSQDLPSVRSGATNNKLRANVTNVSTGSASFHAYISQ